MPTCASWAFPLAVTSLRCASRSVSWMPLRIAFADTLPSDVGQDVFGERAFPDPRPCPDHDQFALTKPAREHVEWFDP